MILHIRGGQVTALYDERLDLRALGPVSIHRASHVEPDAEGRWWAAMVNGPCLGPFELRSQALAAEVAWVESHL